MRNGKAPSARPHAASMQACRHAQKHAFQRQLRRLEGAGEKRHERPHHEQRRIAAEQGTRQCGVAHADRREEQEGEGRHHESERAEQLGALERERTGMERLVRTQIEQRVDEPLVAGEPGKRPARQARVTSRSSGIVCPFPASGLHSSTMIPARSRTRGAREGEPKPNAQRTVAGLRGCRGFGRRNVPVRRFPGDSARPNRRQAGAEAENAMSRLRLQAARGREGASWPSREGACSQAAHGGNAGKRGAHCSTRVGGNAGRHTPREDHRLPRAIPPTRATCDARRARWHAADEVFHLVGGLTNARRATRGAR